MIMSRFSEGFSVGANIATILAAIAAMLAIYFGYNQYIETSTAQRNASAVNLYLDYLRLRREASINSVNREEATHSIGRSTMVTASTIFLLTEDDKGWNNAVKWMLKEHQDIVLPLQCEAYNERFVSFVKKHLQGEVCRK